MQDLGKLKIGETVEEILRCDLGLEVKAMKDLRVAIAHAEEVNDFPSRDLFASILKNEEEHVDFIETQLTLMKQIGTENYIQTQSA